MDNLFIIHLFFIYFIWGFGAASDPVAFGQEFMLPHSGSVCVFLRQLAQRVQDFREI